ncbi:hypothetical protein SAMD00019534_091530 [Acytostelium subglobosum LB1]|uniref:hypothetical protein n=1 Tax=Acytostelium subglobosum LB1 TaxID=1410327 RepID=UPI000644DF34|nr:hypothetical protein SAMD00019534_091530 [Acytostelium subglobosum LB1]GAM25978.1 hypothetical protein SAMD00019534_091530 [Acytostelium subglobosum LB1]|eukprot:XP_012751021.1 hypothetical protein SAMD00019534_091530 [Acytostelium subglobosum LB1]
MERKQFASLFAYWTVKEKSSADNAPTTSTSSTQSNRNVASPTVPGQRRQQYQPQQPAQQQQQQVQPKPQAQDQHIAEEVHAAVIPQTVAQPPQVAQQEAEQNVGVSAYVNVVAAPAAAVASREVPPQQHEHQQHLLRPVGDDSSNDGSNHSTNSHISYVNVSASGYDTLSEHEHVDRIRFSDTISYLSEGSIYQPISAYSIMPMSCGSPHTTQSSAPSSLNASAGGYTNFVGGSPVATATDEASLKYSTYSSYSQMSSNDSEAGSYSSYTQHQLNYGYQKTLTDDESGSSKESLEREKNLLKSREAKDNGRNWNGEFQDILKLPASTAKFDELTFMAMDFVKTAETYGNIIIKEMFMPNHLKTIKPINIGGVAGGAKYICQNILFKFAYDQKIGESYLYGGKVPSDYGASKAAGNELRGLSYFFQNVMDHDFGQINVPLMCLIDSYGYRLIAISVLPIKKDTLIYGSSDGGNTMHNDVDEVNEMMEKVCKKMNLKGHLAGLDPKYIYGPGDFEIHQSPEDNAYYALDFGRLLPPQAYFDSNGHAIAHRDVFFKLLRPELVRTFDRPLSSDAFTGWGSEDPKQEQHNEDIIEATSHLFDIVIRQAATELESLAKQELFKDTFDIGPFVHKFGINLRHLGRLRSMIDSSNTKVRRLILNEMVVRVLKSAIKDELRLKLSVKGHYVGSEKKRFDTIVNFMNRMFNNEDKLAPLKDFWTVQIKLMLGEKYGATTCGLTSEEMHANYDLFFSISLPLLIQRLQKKTGIKFSKRIQEHFDTIEKSTQTNLKPITFPVMFYVDVKSVSSVVKHSNLVARSEGISLYMKALDMIYANMVLYGKPLKEPDFARFNHETNEESQLLKKSKKKLEKASRSSTTDANLNRLLGTLEIEIWKLEKSTSYVVDLAIKYLEQSLAYAETAEVLISLGTVYDLKDEWAKATAYYERLKVLDPALAVPTLFESAATFAPYYSVCDSNKRWKYANTSVHQLIMALSILDMHPTDNATVVEYMPKCYKVLIVALMKCFSLTDNKYYQDFQLVIATCKIETPLYEYIGHSIIERALQKYPTLLDDILHDMVTLIRTTMPFICLMRFAPFTPTFVTKFLDAIKDNPSVLDSLSTEHYEIMNREKLLMKNVLSLGHQFSCLKLREYNDVLKDAIALLPMQTHLQSLSVHSMIMYEHNSYYLSNVAKCFTNTLVTLDLCDVKDNTLEVDLPPGTLLPSLKSFTIRTCMFSQGFLVHLLQSFAGNLEEMTFEGEPLNEQTSLLRQFTKLKHLEACGYVYGFKFDHLPPTLTSLDWCMTIEQNEDEMDLPIVEPLLRQCPGLTHLGTNGMDCQWNKEMALLKKHPLKTIRILANRQTFAEQRMDQGLDVWATSLEYLKICLNQYGDFDRFAQTLSALRNLRKLDCELYYFDDDMLTAFIDNLKCLEYMDTGTAAQLQLRPQPNPFECLRTLKMLKLKVIPSNYEQMGLIFPNLINLSVRSSFGFNDQCFRNLISNFSKLESLMFDFSADITDNGFMSLFTSPCLKTLRTINIGRATSDSSAVRLALMCPTLESIRLYNTKFLCIKTHQFFAARFPHIRIEPALVE